MAKARSGGGIRMNKNVSVGLKTGKDAKGIAPSAAASFGILGAFRITSTGVGSPISKPLGNELARNVGKGGPGTGRDIHPTGSQGHHGTKE